jgi:hypothetical protein
LLLLLLFAAWFGLPDFCVGLWCAVSCCAGAVPLDTRLTLSLGARSLVEEFAGRLDKRQAKKGLTQSDWIGRGRISVNDLQQRSATPAPNVN